MVNPAARSGTSPLDAWPGTPLYLHGHPNLGERVSSFSESRVPYGSARCCSPATWRLRGLHYFSTLAADQHYHFSFIFVRNFRIRGRATRTLPGRATRALPGRAIRALPGLSSSPASPSQPPSLLAPYQGPQVVRGEFGRANSLSLRIFVHSVRCPAVALFVLQNRTAQRLLE